MTVSVRDLKNRLSEFLRRVQAGEHLIVTDRGRPIAELAPLARARMTPEQRLARLSERGEVQVGSGRPLEPFEPIRVKGKPVSATLLEDRG